MRITLFRRLRKDRRGVSNIIVVALSLVVMLAIVSDIVLWNYEMTQADWEKMKENVALINVKSANTPSWVTTQNEYAVNTGTKTTGTYLDTKNVDGSFERFVEADVGVANFTLINNESFESTWPPTDWSITFGSSWNKESDYQHDGTYSADFDGSSGGTGLSGYLFSPVMNCSNADSIYIDFWWLDRGLDNDDFILEFYDGNVWDILQDLNLLESANGWHHYNQKITDSQYLISNFQIRWWANGVWSGETACVDAVTVKKEVTMENLYAFDISCDFSLDLSANQIEHVETIELQLLYRTTDSAETWNLQAYNWDSYVYSDVGFNVTAGHTPTTGWDYHTVNFTDAWQDYVDGDGTVNVRIFDQGGDSDQTTIDIDFLGINVKTDGTQFSFENDGSLTVRLVSLWITNSTYHQRYDIDFLLNSGATKSYVSYEVELPTGDYIVKVVTELGNNAVFSGT